jgi:hypothetical protein
MNTTRTSSLFAPFRAIEVTSFSDRAAGLATVFLIVKLGWEHASSVVDQPMPLLMALLCFFHVMRCLSALLNGRWCNARAR